MVDRLKRDSLATIRRQPDIGYSTMEIFRDTPMDKKHEFYKDKTEEKMLCKMFIEMSIDKAKAIVEKNKTEIPPQIMTNSQRKKLIRICHLIFWLIYAVLKNLRYKSK